MTPSPLSPDQDPELQVAEVAEDFLRRIEQGENPEVNDYAKRYPALAEILQQILPVLTMVGSAPEIWPETNHSFDANTSRERILGDFTILREIGRGGMGVVYEAREMSLGRQVALKVLPFVGLLDPRQLKRFKMEAQVAAQLHHTHIVPVFSVGCERGVHYYAMQYVDGHSLATIIRELKKGESQTTAEVETSLTQSLTHHLTRSGSTQDQAYIHAITRIGIQAADALQHAHDHAIIHRDIKPSNLLLDVEGHLWITNFGLAHCHNGNTATLTLPGDILGTLRYMSPEQAAGQGSILDERTDIYSLGATLYELLTLEVIFEGQGHHELLGRIEGDTPRPLRRLNPTIPVDLETVVLKALAKAPQDRYATCRDLAEDLQRFLDSRPVKARRPGLAEKLAKWARRHRSLVTAAAVVLVVAVVALCVSTVLIWQEKQHTGIALTRAQQHYQQARDAIDESTLIRERELDSPLAVHQTRRELLLKAQGFYRGLLETNSQDALVIKETAHSYQRIGKIHLRLGQSQEAQAAFRAAIDTCARLIRSNPHDPLPQLHRADCTVALAEVLQDLGQVTESLELLGQTVQIEKGIHDQWPENPDYLARLAEAYKRWGIHQSQAGQSQEGLEARTQGAAHQKALSAQYPGNCVYQEKVAMDAAELAEMMWGCGQKPQALNQAKQAVTRYEHLARAFPDQLDLQIGHVRARMIRMGKCRIHQGRSTDGIALVQQAKQLQDSVLHACPDAPRWSWRFGWCWSNVTLAQQYALCAEVLATHSHFQEASAALQAAAQLSPRNATAYKRYQTMAEAGAKAKQRIDAFKTRWLRKGEPVDEESD